MRGTSARCGEARSEGKRGQLRMPPAGNCKCVSARVSLQTSRRYERRKSWFDGRLRRRVGAARARGTACHSASDCGPKPCAERRHTQAIRSLYVRCHNKRTMLRESEPRLTGIALFQFLLKFESFFEILYRRYFYLNQLKPV